jgi:hypothetical protein
LRNSWVGVITSLSPKVATDGVSPLRRDIANHAP